MVPLSYIISFFLLVLGSLVVFRIIVRRDYQRYGRTTPVSSAFEVLICIAFIAFPSTYLPQDWYLLSDSSVPVIRRNIALIIIFTGMGITIIFMSYLGIKRSFGFMQNKLVTSGPYRISRNPQIVSFSIVLLGVLIYWPSWYHLGWLALYGIVFHMMVITEEEHLKQIYDSLYEEYCGTVPRYLDIQRIIVKNS